MSLTSTVIDAVTLRPVGQAINSTLGKADDLLARDESIPLSTVLQRGGWGTKGSQLNRKARHKVQQESNGDPGAVNPSGAIGLFQVMTPLHCGKMGTPQATPACVAYLKDPYNNARVAHSLYLAAGWSPWAASGGEPSETDWDPIVTKKKDSLVGGTVSDAAGTVGDVVGSVTSPFTSVAKAGAALIGALLSPDTWFRIGKGTLGFVFVVTGTGALVYVVANAASGGASGRAVKGAAKTAVKVAVMAPK